MTETDVSLNVILANLKLGLAALLRLYDPMPPFSARRRELHKEAELLREMIRRLTP